MKSNAPQEKMHIRKMMIYAGAVMSLPVSYTHLDVYKRQPLSVS